MSDYFINGVLPNFYSSIKQSTNFDGSWHSGNVDSFEQWKKQSREKLRAALSTPDSIKEFSPEIVTTQDKGDIVTQKLLLNINDNERVVAYLSKPACGDNFPGILMLHDHGAEFRIGKEKMIETWEDDSLKMLSDSWVEKYFSGIYPGDYFARQGYAVLVVDGLGWGYRGPILQDDQQAIASNFYNLGRSLAGAVAYDDLRSLEFLSTLAEVDETRLGVVGFSTGAFRAWQLSALSDLAKATVAACWMGTRNGLMTEGGNLTLGQASFYTLHQDIVRHLDYPDVAGIGAPKPLMLINGADDTLFPPATVTEAYAKLKILWQTQNAEQHLNTQIWQEHGHVFTADQQQSALTWLAQYLMKN